MPIKDRLMQSLSVVLSSALIFSSLTFSQAIHASSPAEQLINRFDLPVELGRISDSYVGSSSKSVVLIQDLHLHYPTQKRILKILDQFYARNSVSGPIAIEGVQGDFDLSAIASYPAGKSKDRLVDYFMQKGELSGDEAFAILRSDGHLLRGVDDHCLYQLDRELYKGSLLQRKTLQARVTRLQKQISILKKEHYNRVLRRLDEQDANDIPSAEALLQEKMKAAGELNTGNGIKEAAFVQNIIEMDHVLGFLSKILRQETTLDEVQYIAQRLPSLSELSAKLVGFQASEVQDTLKSAIDFYTVALMRDEPIALQTAALLGKSNSVALVVGGFHTAGIVREFKKAGVSYVVISPTIDEVRQDYHDLYEARVAGRHITIPEVAHDLHGAVPESVDEANLPPTATLRVATELPGQLKSVWDFAWEKNQPQRISLRDRVQAFPGWKPLALITAGVGLVGVTAAYGLGWIQLPAQAFFVAVPIVAGVLIAGMPHRVSFFPSQKPMDSGSGSSRPKQPLPVAMTNLPPDRELAILQAVLARLKQEELNPGTGGLPTVAVISDQHGTIDKFDALIVDAIGSVLPEGQLPEDFKLDPDKTLQEQLGFYGVKVPDDLKGRIYFHNLGDFMDRGPYGVKIFNRSLELIKLGLSDFVIGNHDFWEFMNLQAFHLPWYRGFNFYGYQDDYDATHGKVDDLVEIHHQPESVTGTKSWWAKKLAEFTAYHEKRQKEYWNHYDELINGKLVPGLKDRTPGLYAHVGPVLKPDSKAQRTWDLVRGWYAPGKIDVYTGTRATGTVSIKWWQNRLADLKEEYGQALSADLNEDMPAAEAWRETIHLIENEIIPELRRDLETHLAQGEWWWRIFEAINYQNYSTPEWWAKDWVFHEGWGTSVLKELSKMSGTDVTTTNYLDNPTLNQTADFFRDHFALYSRDIYQNVYMHGFLPVDPKTAEFFFTYKGQEYRGKGSLGHPSVWEGLDRITADIRNPENSMSDLYQALSLVNEWYADNTTQAKVPNVAAAINRHGPEKLAQANGFNRLFTAHLPFHEFIKLKEKAGIIKGFLTGERFIFTDHGMGTKFGSRGAWVHVSPQGLFLRGFEHERAGKIISDPKTVKTVEGIDGPVEQVLFHNPGMSREQFLPQLIHDVQKRIVDLQARQHPPLLGNSFPTILAAVTVGWGYLWATSAKAAIPQSEMSPIIQHAITHSGIPGWVGFGVAALAIGLAFSTLQWALHTYVGYVEVRLQAKLERSEAHALSAEIQSDPQIQDLLAHIQQRWVFKGKILPSPAFLMALVKFVRDRRQRESIARQLDQKQGAIFTAA